MQRLATLTLAVLVIGCATAGPSVTAPSAPAAGPALTPPALRLPQGVRPTHYQLEFKIVPGSETFTGTTSIDVVLEKPSAVIWLHGTELTIAKAALHQGGLIIAAKTQAFPPDQLAVILDHAPQAGAATLRFEYQGPLSRTNIAGLFQLREGDDDYVFTQFEATDARRAFPSFDEPRFKVPFDVSVVVKNEHQAFGNNPVASEQPAEQGFKRVTFSTTPALPTYLVAVAVGPFETVDAGKWGKNQVPVRIITPRGKVKDAGLAARETGPVVQALESYFGTLYPFEKLDQIAMPTGFGAMENPGLVTYGSRLLLVPPAEEAPDRQRNFVSVCAHELAHQWFGNLVTMAWWNDVWLNEAFASWLGEKTVATLKPSWGNDLDQVGDRNRALSADALVSARRIRQPIETADDIANAFDAITYSKGASVIAMHEQLIGEDAFRNGVRRYLTEHARGNATTDDFISALAAEAKTDVRASMSSFLDQPGAPLLSLSTQCSKGTAPMVRLAQSRYLPLGSAGKAEQSWRLPVCIRYAVAGKEQRQCAVMTKAEEEWPLPQASKCPDWVLPNDGFRGYYRSRITGGSSTVALFKTAGKKLSPAERLGLLGDLRAEVAAGQIDVGDALALVPAVATEANYRLVGAATALVDILDGRKLVSDAQRPLYESYLRHTFGPRAKQLGLKVSPRDDENTRLLRPTLLVTVGADGNDTALQSQALPLAKTWVKERKGIDPDVVDEVLSVAARTGDAELHRSLREAVLAEKDSSQRRQLLEALGSFTDAALVKTQLPLTLDPALAGNEALGLLWSSASKPQLQDTTLAFLRDHWDALIKRLPEDSRAYVVTLATGYCDEAHRDETAAFFKERSAAFNGGPRIYNGVMERIDLCIQFRARQQKSATAFLEKSAAAKKSAAGAAR